MSYKVLNLSKGFNPHNAKEENLLQFKTFTFSGGEPHIKLDLSDDEYDYEEVDSVYVTIRINSYNDMGLLKMAMNALRYELTDLKYQLLLPYMPGARQDRVMVEGEPLSVKVYADDINSLGFETVGILDPHSDVSIALINNVIVHSNYKFIDEVVETIWDRIQVPLGIVSPDAGANKKILKLMQHLGDSLFYDMIKCDKTRDVATGALSGFEVYAKDIEGQDMLIVDDICDGGGTFIGLAEALKAKGAGNLYLATTHGIFSRGFKELEKHFEHIFTTDSIKSEYFYDSTEHKNQGVKPLKLTVIPVRL